jgi:hypothetical protein
MATYKQVAFIERLMNERDITELYDSVEAQTVRAGMGEELSTGQASRFIDALMNCPQKPKATATKTIGEKVNHPTFGQGTITDTDDRLEAYIIDFSGTVKKISYTFNF